MRYLKNKSIIIIISILIALVLFFIAPQVAQSENYFYIRRYIGQPVDKTWTITFNKSVNMETVGNSAIQVKLNNDNIPIQITNINDRQLLVSGNWQPGKNYTLYINNTIKSTRDDEQLSRAVMMPFSIIDQEQYRFELTWDTRADLDLNLTLPNGETVNATNPINEFAELDMDIVSGFGAENILLKQVLNRQMYKIYVTSFAELAESNATVKVYNNEGLLRTFVIPDNWSKNKWIACYMYGDLLIVGERY